MTMGLQVVGLPLSGKVADTTVHGKWRQNKNTVAVYSRSASGRGCRVHAMAAGLSPTRHVQLSDKHVGCMHTTSLRHESVAQRCAQSGGGVSLLLELRLAVDVSVFGPGGAHFASGFVWLVCAAPFFVFRVEADLANAHAVALWGVADFGCGFSCETKHWIENQVECMRAQA